MDIKPPISSGPPPSKSSNAAQNTSESNNALSSLGVDKASPFGAKVISSTPAPSNAGQSSISSQAGQTSAQQFLSTLSANGKTFVTLGDTQLKPGQLLKLQIDSGNTLKLINISTPDPALLLKTIQQQLRSSLPQQLPPGKLLETLIALNNSKETALPKEVKGAIAKLLSQLPSPMQLSSSAGVKQALQQSGGILERFLLHKLNQEQSAKGTSTQNEATDKSLAKDYKANLLQLLKQVETNKASPGKTTEGKTGTTQHPQLTYDSPKKSAFENQSPLEQTSKDGILQKKSLHYSKGIVDATSLPRNELLNIIYKQVMASLSRNLVHQLSTLLKQQGKTPQEISLGTFFQTEIPIYHNGLQNTLLVQIEKREPPPEESEDTQEKEREWNIILSFDLHALGEVQAQARIMRESVYTKFWATRTDTLEIIKHNKYFLEEALIDAGLNVEQIECCKGVPPKISTQLDYNLVDINT